MSSAISKELWVDHQNHPVTKALKQACLERIEEIKDQIVSSRDGEYDMFLKGMIWAQNEVFDAKPDLIEDSEESNEVQARDTGASGDPQAED